MVKDPAKEASAKKILLNKYKEIPSYKNYIKVKRYYFYEKTLTIREIIRKGVKRNKEVIYTEMDDIIDIPPEDDAFVSGKKK